MGNDNSLVVPVLIIPSTNFSKVKHAIGKILPAFPSGGVDCCPFFQPSVKTLILLSSFAVFPSHWPKSHSANPGTAMGVISGYKYYRSAHSALKGWYKPPPPLDIDNFGTIPATIFLLKTEYPWNQYICPFD